MEHLKHGGLECPSAICYAHCLQYYTYSGLQYRQCGLSDHNVVESINKLEILSFLLFFTSVYGHPKQKKIVFCNHLQHSHQLPPLIDFILQNAQIECPSAVHIGIHAVCTYSGLFYGQCGLVDHNVVETKFRFCYFYFFYKWTNRILIRKKFAHFVAICLYLYCSSLFCY